MRKFYSTVTIVALPGGFSIHLDDKPVRTPTRNLLLLATEALAEAVAAEWRAQGDTIQPVSMPLTQLSSTALDRVEPYREAIVDGVVEYVATDLVCYRALEPAELVRQQSGLFDPLLEWFEERTSQWLVVVRGIMPVHQPEAALEIVRSIVSAKSTMELTAIQFGAALASSFVISLALAEGRLNAAEAYETANAEELYQIGKWGEDDEARIRLSRVRGEFDALERFIRLAKE